MSGTLIALLILFAIALLWLDGARAREMACAVVDEMCRRRGFQLLDETVAQERLGVVRTDAGLRLRRLFRFDYSVEGVGRQQGHVLMHGSRAVLVDLPDDDLTQDPAGRTAPQSAAPDNKKGDDNVIPFRRRH